MCLFGNDTKNAELKKQTNKQTTTTKKKQTESKQNKTKQTHEEKWLESNSQEAGVV